MPQLLVIAGPAGSGKTTTAEALAQLVGAPHVDFDTATAAFVDAQRSMHPDRTEAELLAVLRDERYRVFAAAVAAMLETHAVVIASAPFTSHVQNETAWGHWLDLLPNATDVTLCWLHLDPSDRLNRMTARGSERDAALIASGSAPAVALPAIRHVLIDAALPAAANASRISSLIR